MTGGRRRVALVFPACHRRGGVERVVREHARRLAQDHDVTFVGWELDPTDLDAIDFVEVDQPPSGLPGRVVPSEVWFRRAAGRAVDAGGFDVVVSFGANCPPGDVLVVQSVHQAWLRSSGSIPTKVGSVPAATRFVMPQHLALLAMERTYFRSARPARVLACSDRTGREVVDLYGVPPERVGTMFNGYDAAEFNLDVRARDREPTRRRAGIGAGDVAILFVANELHRKGFATLIEAVAGVGEESVHIHVVGRVDGEAYQRRVEELGLGDRVHWHGPQADVAEWYAAGDLFVLPTQYEPFGNVIVEALATGLPVVTTAIAGASSAVLPDVNGFLQTDATDAGELQRLLRTALDPATLGRLQAGATTGVERFEWDRLTTVLDGAIRAVGAA